MLDEAAEAHAKAGPVHSREPRPPTRLIASPTTPAGSSSTSEALTVADCVGPGCAIAGRPGCDGLRLRVAQDKLAARTADVSDQISTTGGLMARREERPMRILIVTAASRGDVAPFTGLGQQLQQAGHWVALAAHGMFADLVRRCGLEYRPLPSDPVALTR